MDIFFTADTHFGHKRTLELSKRPFDSVGEMDSEIIWRWNSIVHPNDIIYHLGDFGNVEIRPHLNGDIKFLPGNYDDEKTVVTLASTCEIIEPNHKFEIPEQSFRLTLVHEPDEAVKVTGSFFLFGHIHKLQMVKRNGLNVGVDCHDYHPISIEDVLFYRNAILNHYDENVFIPEL